VPLTPGPEYVPPAGWPPLKATCAPFTHTDAKLPSVTTGTEFTTIFVCAELLQPFPEVYEYVNGNVPAPDGVKIFPLTPVPEYVPPEGLPFVKVSAPLFVQTGETELSVTAGAALTRITEVALAVQLCAFV
jgi:hypothetical protein